LPQARWKLIIRVKSPLTSTPLRRAKPTRNGVYPVLLDRHLPKQNGEPDSPADHGQDGYAVHVGTPVSVGPSGSAPESRSPNTTYPLKTRRRTAFTPTQIVATSRTPRPSYASASACLT